MWKKLIHITKALRRPNVVDFNFLPIRYAITIESIPTIKLEILKNINSFFNNKKILKK